MYVTGLNRGAAALHPATSPDNLYASCLLRVPDKLFLRGRRSAVIITKIKVKARSLLTVDQPLRHRVIRGMARQH